MGNELSPGPFPRGLFLFSAKHSPSMSGGIYHSITRFARSVPLVSFAFVSFLLHPPVRCLHPNTANERSFFSSSGIIGSLKELLRSGQSFIGILSDPLSPAIANRRRLVCASARASSQDAFISSLRGSPLGSMVAFLSRVRENVIKLSRDTRFIQLR